MRTLAAALTLSLWTTLSWGGLVEAQKLREAIRERDDEKARASVVIRLPVSRGFDQKDSDLCWAHSFLSAQETLARVKDPQSRLELSRKAMQRLTLEDRLARKIRGEDDFLMERGTPMDALALARAHGLVVFAPGEDILMGIKNRYNSIYRSVRSAGEAPVQLEALAVRLDEIFNPFPLTTRFEGTTLSPRELADTLLAGQRWQALVPDEQEGEGDHPDPDARPETRAYHQPLSKIVAEIKRALSSGRPVTYGGDGHSVLIYGMGLDEDGEVIRYYIKDSYPDFFYDASPARLHRAMLEVSLPLGAN